MDDLKLNLLHFNDAQKKDWIQHRKPYSVLFEITAKCNMNCIHCYLYNNHQKDALSYQQIKGIIDLLYEKGILFLTLTGGEILTRPDFLDIYLYAKKKGFLVELFTNGYLINDEIISVFQKYPPLLIDISLYGASNETYQKVTGLSGAFEKVVQNCLKLKEAGIRVSLKSPIIKETIGDLDAMRQLAKDIDIKFVYSFEIAPTIEGEKTSVSHQLDADIFLNYEFENYYEQIARGDYTTERHNETLLDALFQNKHVYTCNVATNSFVIDYQGNILPCMKLRHKGMSIFEHDFDVIWDHFKQYKELLASKQYACNGCKDKYYCDICPAEMDLLYGDPEFRTEEMCAVARKRRAFYEKNDV